MDPVVKTLNGELRGSLADGVHSFKGVPYAAPPFGANRLRPPQPVVPWSGVRDALAVGPWAPQLAPPPGSEGFYPADPPVPGEDCLNLNVWTPDAGSAGLPVMVWIHPSMFELGSGAQYEGSRFAHDGVVCVTINYRLGVEGFLYLGDGIANLGLLDQIAALEWVQGNIAAFGGDPANVTIFGESAGAMSVGTLLAIPRGEGLFRRAIMESGAAHTVMPAAAARRVGRQLAEKLGVEATREAIAAVPLDRVLAAQGELKAELGAHYLAVETGTARPDLGRWGAEVLTTCLPWHPVVDGDVIPAPPIERIVAGAGAKVDVLVGTNVDDWRLFVVASGIVDQVTDQALAGFAAMLGLPAEAALAAYRAARPGVSAGDLLAVMQTDWWCRIPALRLADAHAKGASATYMYEFAWRSPVFSGLLGACHALELGFVFDTLSNEGTRLLTGPNPPQELADTMHRSWVAFATSADPGWPAYDLTRRATMRLDTTSEVVDDPRSLERALWEGIR